MGSLSACDKALEVEPTTTVEADIAVFDLKSLNTAALGAYSALQPTDYYGSRYLLYQGVYSDNLEFRGTYTTDLEVANRVINPSNLQLLEIWGAIYVVINRANTVIAQADRLQEEGTITAEDADAIKGEMFFLRGLAYFDLVKVFGDVPLELEATTSLTDVTSAPRASQEQVYQSIITDLTTAEELMGTSERLDPTRASGLAASALLARVYLQHGDYALAQSKANEVIESGQFELIDNFGNIFATEGLGNSESIFEIDYTTNNQNTLGTSSNPNTPGQKFYVSADAYEALEASAENGDKRFAATTQVGGTDERRRLVKYEDIVNNADNVIIIRLAEMYLVRAEAAARLADAGAAASEQVLADINQVRTRAGLSKVAGLTNAQALNEVLEQRRLEFVGEGLRFIDLKRYNLTGELLGFEGNNAFRNLWPVPLQEIELNPNLAPQNPGY